jgi:hypothetical protein
MKGTIFKMMIYTSECICARLFRHFSCNFYTFFSYDVSLYGRKEYNIILYITRPKNQYALQFSKFSRKATGNAIAIP